MTGIPLIAAWGVVVLAAMDGWGGLAARLVPDKAVDTGLRLAWGMAVILALGGALTALSLAARPRVMIVVVLGALLAVPRWRREANWRLVAPVGLVAGLILALHYLGQVTLVEASCTDDYLAYWGFIKRQLVLGAVDEPFSLRRLAGHGGQIFLQSLVVATGGLDNAFLVERGISPIIIYLLLRGALPGRAPALPALALAMALLLIVDEFNSQSLYTGVVLFLALARTLVLLDGTPLIRPGALILVGLLTAGVSSLRAHFIAGAALIAAGWLLSRWDGLRPSRGLSVRPESLVGRSIGSFRRRVRRRLAAMSRHRGGTASFPAPKIPRWPSVTTLSGRTLSVRATILAGGALVFFAPWMAGLWRSSGTPLFPLFAGTGAGGYDSFQSAGTTFYDLALDYATTPSGLSLVLPVLALWRPAPERRVLAISYGASLLVLLLFSWRFPNSDPWDLARYMWPLVAVPVFLSAIVLIRAARLHEAGRPVVLALIAGGFLIGAGRIGHDINQWAKMFASGESSEETRLGELQRRLQNLVPEGETLLVATDRPYLVDYRRNKTWNVDVPGAASPLPGMPFFHGPEAVRDYLLAAGVHYVLFTDGMRANPCLYNRPRFTDPKMRLEPALWQLQGRYILDFLNNMADLAASGTVLGQQDNHVLLRLDNRPAGSEAASPRPAGR